jgi:hypothetical protein
MSKFSIQADQWFTWQMVPGYLGGQSVPFFSPIYVTDVHPLKTGKNILRLKFLNVLYAPGVQDFNIDLKLLKRDKDYLIGELTGEDSGRVAIISHIGFAWVERFCPELWYQRPPSSTKYGKDSIRGYLDDIFFGDNPPRPESK